jgi:integration host factor subunit beta
MNAGQLIEILSNKFDITRQTAKVCLEAVFDSMADTLAKGGRVEIRGFATLKVKEYKPYVGHNPKTGKQLQVSAKRLPVFKMGADLKRRVNPIPLTADIFEREDRRLYGRNLVKWPASIMTLGREIRGEVLNINSEGAFFFTHTGPIDLEGNFYMVIKPPGQRAMKIAPRVIWTATLTTKKGEASTGVGFQFVQISEANRRFLHKLTTNSKKK